MPYANKATPIKHSDMKNLLISLRPLVIAAVSLLFMAVQCDYVENSMEETQTGRMVLGFVVDGETVNCSIAGTENSVFADILEGDTLEIRAGMHHDVYGPIVLKIPMSEIGDSPINDPVIQMQYLYKVIPNPPTVDFGPGKKYEYLYAEPEDASISFRFWDLDEGIVAGNFSFSFDRHYADGKVGRVHVERGNFDIDFKREEQL